MPTLDTTSEPTSTSTRKNVGGRPPKSPENVRRTKWRTTRFTQEQFEQVVSAELSAPFSSRTELVRSAALDKARKVLRAATSLDAHTVQQPAPRKRAKTLHRPVSLTINLTPNEFRAIQMAASMCQVSQAEFIRSAALEATAEAY